MSNKFFDKVNKGVLKRTNQQIEKLMRATYNVHLNYNPIDFKDYCTCVKIEFDQICHNCYKGGKN